MDLSQLPDRLGSTVDELRDRTASAVKAESGSVFRELKALGKQVGELDERVERLADLGAEQNDLFEELVTASKRTSWPRRLVWLLLGVALGAGAAYLADPDRGRSRRSQLGDQLAARARDVTDEVGGQARDVAQRTKGAAVETAKDALPEDVPDDPKLLEERVKSHALGGRDDVTDVVLRVDAPGQVALKGTVPSAESERELLTAVAEVEGVVDVRSELTVRAG